MLLIDGAMLLILLFSSECGKWPILSFLPWVKTIPSSSSLSDIPLSLKHHGGGVTCDLLLHELKGVLPEKKKSKSTKPDEPRFYFFRLALRRHHPSLLPGFRTELVRTRRSLGGAQPWRFLGDHVLYRIAGLNTLVK